MLLSRFPSFVRYQTVSATRFLARRSFLPALAISALAAAYSLAGAAPAAAAPEASIVATLYAWGDNTYGQIGDGTTLSSTFPTLVALPPGVTAVGGSSGFTASLAVGSDGKVYAWGNNQFGQLGNGSTTDSSTPVAVSLPGGIAAVAVSEGADTSLALGANGTVYAWGSNLAGQLGDGTQTGPETCDTTACSTTPVAVTLPGGVTATAVAEGELYTSYALGSNGTLYAWGDDAYGQLANGTTAGPQTCGGVGCSLTPLAISLPGGVKAAAVSTGAATSMALGSDGNVYTWGQNTYGQLGNGSTTDSATPVLASLPTGIAATAVSMGFGTGMALGSDGTIYAWGDNSEGQLGNGSTTNIATPVPVSLPGGIAATAISAGAATNFAVASDGNVYAWGGNNDGQLGNGSVTGSATPVQVPFPAGVTVAAVYAGDQTEFAIAGYPAAPQSAGSMAVTVAVPQTGMLTVTVSTGAIDLALQGATAPLVATGSLNTVTVTDTRNTVPGWSVSGQDTAFTGSGTAASSSIPGDELGWAPSGTVPAGATLGPSVAPGASPGLADAAQVLASAAPGAGMGTASVSATLTLDIPATAHAGPYTGTLTITYLISGP